MKNLFYGEKHSFIKWTYDRDNSNMYQQHMLLKLRKPILKYTLNKNHGHWISFFKQLKSANTCMVGPHYSLIIK